MDWKNILILISAGIYLFLGIFVYSRGRDKLSNKTYSVIAFSVFYWSIGMFLYRFADSVEDSILWCRILYVAPICIVLSFLSFSYVFPRDLREKKGVVFKIILFLGVLLALMSLFSSSIIKDVVLNSRGEKTIIFGFYYFIFYPLYIVSVFIWAYIVLIKKFYQSLGVEKSQILYVFWGTFLSSTFSMITNLTLPSFGIFYFNWLGQILSLIMVLFIAYAIIRHRLMDIKMVLRSSSVYLSSLLTIVMVAVVANTIFYKYFPLYIYWTNLFVLVLATSFFAGLKKKYFRLANKYFFSSLYDPQKLIASLSDKLRTTLDVDVIYNFLFELLDDSFHFKDFAILSYSEEKGSYFLEFNKGFDVERKKIFQGSSFLHTNLIGQNKVIFTEEVKNNFYNENSKDVIELLIKLNIEVLIPLNVKDKTVGLIALGKKESGDMYNEGDLQVLEIVGAQAATSIENAYLYEKTLNFNLKLKDEVEKATRELVAANKKLIKLDEAKSEFISIASHQLRTPLTIIKGYISMILEGNFGELTPGEKDSLDKVYLSNERLIQLVENLLNISRIESGRLQFDYKEMQLSDIIDSVVEELEPKAKGKGLKFTYKKSKKKMPNINIDEEKIRQVVMNLIDNAIKYTKKGSVTVSLDMVKPRDPKMPMCLEFKVADSGMGISADDLPNLFKKFSRGTGSSLVHTEGTGLGLYVARQMIESHHGKIWAESIGENKGSKFCFRISLDNPEAKLVVEKKGEKKVKKVKA